MGLKVCESNLCWLSLPVVSFDKFGSIGRRGVTVGSEASVAVLQSHYLPWLGYFDLLGACDYFVIYDHVDFTKNSFQNRNRLRGANGYFWLTVPVKTSSRFGQNLESVQIADDRWSRRHWFAIRQTLAGATHFQDFVSEWEEAFMGVSRLSSLSRVSEVFLRLISQQLRLKTTILRDSDLGIESTDRNLKLVEICEKLGARTYRTGRSALNYLDSKAFLNHGIQVQTIAYSNYGRLPNQLSVSTLQTMAEFGTDTTSLLKGSFETLI